MDYLERNRDFKGVWIPKSIWLNENLTTLEKIILIEVDSLDNEDHCVAGNEYLAQFCQCSEWKVSTAIKKLQELGYIEVIAFDGRHRRIRSCLKNFQGQHLENPKADSEKPKAIKINNNIATNINTQGNGETSSPSENKSTSSKRISRKEQLVNYVNELDYSEETKQALLDWIFQIGIGRGVTVHQLHDMLKDIWSKYDDEDLVRQSIKESYLKNWFGFFPLKNNPVAQRKETQPNTKYKQANLADIDYSEAY